jgi:sucrose-6-phosphate hydrolase SacC (GH32 family)
MSNWEYANVEPTELWRGAMSVARTLALRRVGGTWQLVQQPVSALESLREPLFFAGGSIIGADAPVGLEKVSGDTLDLEVTLAPGEAREVGVIVRKGANEETVIGYDAHAKTIFIDRTRSGRADFDKRFPGRHAAEVRPVSDGSVSMRILVDRSSVEVFADGGATIITDRIYPSLDSRGTALFARGGAGRLIDLKAWRLRSTWRRPGGSQ